MSTPHPGPPVTTRIAIVTGSQPETDPDQGPLAAALTARGATVTVAAWNDPTVKWDGYHLAVIRSTWDYTSAAADFGRWVLAAGELTRVVNPPPVLVWNSDKHYLAELGAAGIPVVPTEYLEPGSRWSPPDLERYVLKPAVSADSRHTGRFRRGVDDAEAAALAAEILTPGARLGDATLAAGRAVMVQPYLRSVATEGETSLIHLGGRFSHAVTKGAALAFGGHGLGAHEYYAAITPAHASREQRAVAEAALAAVPGREPPAYARVDLVRDDEERELLLELELIEPSLHLQASPGGFDRFAEVLLAQAPGHR